MTSSSPSSAPLSPARVIDVAPARIETWVAGFLARHGEAERFTGGDIVIFTAADGATASIEPPFRPLPPTWADGEPIASLAAHALAPRAIGVLLVRLGGYAAGVFEHDELVASKVGARQVHGRSAAGGWSQQRFARRREGQAKAALGAAADAAVGVLLPALPRLHAVVTGGDRQALRAVLADPRLSGLASKVSSRVLDVPDPKARVLRDSIRAATAVRVTISEPLAP